MKKSFDLNIDTSDYLGGLKATLNDLRQSWQQDWVGLPAVLQACQQALGVCRLHAGQDLRIQAVNLLALTIAEHMERQKGQQPAYHNNLHTADVLVSVTVLIVVQMQLQPMTAVDKLWLADVLAAAAGGGGAAPKLLHDAQHDDSAGAMHDATPQPKEQQQPPVVRRMSAFL
jgi:hypothetical protein